MTQHTRNPLLAGGENVEQDTDALESKFGDLAKTYAENREEAAKLRGADEAAEHWRKVESQIDEGGDEE